MRKLTAAIILPILATVATAEDRPVYSAHDSIRKAQIGSYSPRLAPSLRVEGSARPTSNQFDRMECHADPSKPLEQTFICIAKNVD